MEKEKCCVSNIEKIRDKFLSYKRRYNLYKHFKLNDFNSVCNLFCEVDYCNYNLFDYIEFNNYYLTNIYPYEYNNNHNDIIFFVNDFEKDFYYPYHFHYAKELESNNLEFLFCCCKVKYFYLEIKANILILDNDFQIDDLVKMGNDVIYLINKTLSVYNDLKYKNKREKNTIIRFKEDIYAFLTFLYDFIDNIEEAFNTSNILLKDFDSSVGKTYLIKYYLNTNDYFSEIKALEVYKTFLQKQEDFKENDVNNYLSSSLVLLQYYKKHNNYVDALKIIYDLKSRKDVDLNKYGYYNEEIVKLNITFESQKKEFEKPLIDSSIFEKLLQKNYIDSNIFEKMTDDIKIYIQTSFKLYDLIRREDSLTYDYSAINISMFKAVESILFTIGVRYHKYVYENIDSIDLSLIPNSWKVKDSSQIVPGIENLELGAALVCMRKRKNDRGVVNNNFEQFCNSINPEILLKHGSDLKSLIDSLLKIKELRNKTAHKLRVPESDVGDCREQLFESVYFIKKVYQCFGDILK